MNVKPGINFKVTVIIHNWEVESSIRGKNPEPNSEELESRPYSALNLFRELFQASFLTYRMQR